MMLKGCTLFTYVLDKYNSCDSTQSTRLAFSIYTKTWFSESRVDTIYPNKIETLSDWYTSNVLRNQMRWIKLRVRAPTLAKYYWSSLYIIIESLETFNRRICRLGEFISCGKFIIKL